MSLNEMLRPLDDYLKSINENKTQVILISILIGIITIVYLNSSTDNFIHKLFSSNIFKLVIFVLITYIGSSSPGIGISLAILFLVVIQLINNRTIKSENFVSGVLDTSNLYDTRPLEELDQLPYPTKKDFSLNVITPKQYYTNMINNGKNLLEKSLNIESGPLHSDFKEQQLAILDYLKGMKLVESGVNRLQPANNGTYSQITVEDLRKKLDSITSNIGNKSSEDTKKDIETFYAMETILIEDIYKTNKDKYSPEQQDYIGELILSIKSNINGQKEKITEIIKLL